MCNHFNWFTLCVVYIANLRSSEILQIYLITYNVYSFILCNKNGEFFIAYRNCVTATAGPDYSMELTGPSVVRHFARGDIYLFFQLNNTYLYKYDLYSTLHDDCLHLRSNHSRGHGFDSRLYPSNFSGNIWSGTGTTT